MHQDECILADSAPIFNRRARGRRGARSQIEKITDPESPPKPYYRTSNSAIEKRFRMRTQPKRNRVAPKADSNATKEIRQVRMIPKKSNRDDITFVIA